MGQILDNHQQARLRPQYIKHAKQEKNIFFNNKSYIDLQERSYIGIHIDKNGFDPNTGFSRKKNKIKQ